MTVHASHIVAAALTQANKPYVFGVENDRITDINQAKAWDCSELVQTVCRLFGVTPSMPDGAINQWQHCRNHGTMIPVDQAKLTPGALLFIGPGTDGGRRGREAIWHVAISRGDGTTIEAKSTKDGTGTWVIGDRFDWAALIPGVDHSHTPPAPAPKPEEGTMAEAYYQIADDPTTAGDFPKGAILAVGGGTFTHLTPDDWELIRFLAGLENKEPAVTQINQRFARTAIRRRLLNAVALNNAATTTLANSTSNPAVDAGAVVTEIARRLAA